MYRRILIALLCVLLLAPVGAAAAQSSAPHIDSIEIQILPEYDRPDVLVIYRITLASDTALPAQISVRIPASSGGPYNVAYQDWNGGLVYAHYDTPAREGEWLRIDIRTETPVVQVEYYDPGLVKQGEARTFEYQWPGDLAADALSMLVGTPVNAANMQATPVNVPDGRNPLSAPMPVAAGESFSLQLSYNKPDDALSATQPIEPMEAAGTPEKSTLGELLQPLRSGDSLLLVGIVVVGVLFLVGGVLMLAGNWQPGKARKAGKRTRRHAAAAREEDGEAEEDGAVYCHQCGKQAREDDVFCRVCGSRLRDR